MRRMRFLVVVLILAAAGTAFASGGSENAGKAPATITYAYWDQNFTPYVNDIIAAFNKGEPNIKVETQVIPWAEYWNKLQASVAGGTAADVLWMDVPYYNVYVKNGTLKKLDELIARDKIDMSNFPVNGYQGLADGQYTMPNNFDVMGLWYNKKIFDAAGQAYPNPSWTWDDLKNVARKLTKGDVYGFVANPDGYTGWWNFVAQAGSHLTNGDGTKVTFDDQAGSDAIAFYTSFITEGLSPDGPTLASGDPSSIFTSGKAAMMIQGSFMIPPLSKNTDFNCTALPRGVVSTSFTHNMSNAMWAKSKHPEEAWKFLKFLSSKEGITIQARNGNNVPDFKGVEGVWINAYPGLNLKDLYDQVGKQTSWPPGTMEYLDAISKVWTDTYNGNLPWKDLAAASAKAGNDVLAGKK